MSRALLFAACLSWLACAAQAQEQRVYRCGADGRSYSQEPCEAGRGINVADPRSVQQAAQARQVAQRDTRLADSLQHQRLQAEHVAARQGPALISASKPVHRVDKPCRAACRHKADRVTLYRAPETR
jgi:hypothetical protein